MMITFQAFKTAINTLVFPDLMAETRVPLFRNFIVNGLIQLQTYVESYQLTNVNFYDKDQSWDDCGLSIIQGCRGRIGAVYAFKPSCRCQRFFYDSASLEKLSCLYEHCRCHQAGTCCCGQSAFSAPSLYTANPYYCGDYVPGPTGCLPPYLAATPEDDCAFRLSQKYFAVGPNQKLWLFPRFPCGYVLGVHWRGTRRTYLDNDYVPDDEDLKDAIATYVESEIARRVDKDQATADKLYSSYRMKAGDIIFREEQDLKPRCTRVCVEGLDLSELVQIYPDNNYPTNVGESCATTVVTEPPLELEAPVLDLSRISANSSHIPVQWTPEGTQPETYEIWRSVNGGAFAMIGTVDGDVTNYIDTNPMASGDIWCWKVRGVTGETESDFSNECCAVNEYFFPGAGAVSFPTLVLAFGNLESEDISIVTSASFPKLKYVEGILFLDGAGMMSVNLDSLISVDQLVISQSQITVLLLPSFVSTELGIDASLCPNLTTLYAPVFTTSGGDINFDSCALTDVNIASLVMTNGLGYFFDNNALTAATVEHILARGVASGITSASISVNGGTAAGLSALNAQGQADFATLDGAGNTIGINP